jgi:hypothetical protein
LVAGQIVTTKPVSIEPSVLNLKMISAGGPPRA